MCYPLFMLKFVQNFKKSGRQNDPKIGSKSQKAWILGVFRPILRSATAVYSCRTAGKKYLCFSNILSFLHGFYAVLHTTTRLSCIYSLLTTFSAGPNYHLLYDEHYYSVPYSMYGQPAFLKATMAEIRICDRNNKLICAHRRSYTTFPKYITKTEHMP